MKKILITLFLIALPILAQNNKGKISLIYNEEKFDLPITQVLIRKENDVLVSIRAEKNDSLGQQSISLEFPIDNLSSEPKDPKFAEFRLMIFSQDRKDPYGKRFTFNYGPRESVVEMYYGNEKLNWSLPSLRFLYSKVEISHSSEGLRIKGSFSGKYNSTQPGNPLKTMVEIKEGKFEIIL